MSQTFKECVDVFWVWFPEALEAADRFYQTIESGVDETMDQLELNGRFQWHPFA